MEKRIKHAEVDRLMISKRRRRSSSKSMKKLEQLPIDIIIEIFLKLPAKSIARFRCISRDWFFILRSPDFTNRFLTVSYSRPRLFFAVKTEGDKWLFLSASQPLNPDNNSSPLVVDYHMSFSLTTCFNHLNAPVNGLLCTANVYKCLFKDSKVMIYNPSTGQSIPLPIKNGRRDYYAITFFGYDPINRQYKVLCMSMRSQLVIEHKVLTLGIKIPAWRMIECSLPLHYPYSPICINGVLYYLASHSSRETLVCFDVRSEKFKFIEANNKVKSSSRLINYKGKLGLLSRADFFDGKTKSIELLILDDVETNEWSQHIYVLPPLWKDLVANQSVSIAGMTGNGELVFSSIVYNPFYIFFYNLEKSTIARVRIQGIHSSRSQFIQTFVDHVENLKLI